MNLLHAANLSFMYDARPALSGVSIDLRPGELVALLGPNASGKSTLIKCLLGHLRPAGEILWNDRLIRSWKPRELAGVIAYLPQSPSFDPDHTVADVLRLGRAPYLGTLGIESQHDMEIVRRVAATLELTDLLTRPLDALSGGQRQRVFIGRCLVQEPRALLLDEPSTYLDLKHQIDLLSLLQKLTREQNLAVLMASHDLNLAGLFANRLVLLDKGKVVVDGSAEDVLSPERIERVYGVTMERVILADGRSALIPRPN